MVTLKRPRPFLLVILDGWGYREEKEFNAIALAHKPNWNLFWEKYPHTLVSGSGRCVGLPEGQMGNSEVGHLNIGAGRVINQDLTRINLDIQSGNFFSNPVLKNTIEQTIENDKTLHIMGLLSPGGIHSHEEHFYSLLELAARLGAKKVFIHPFLDGRDTPPQSATSSLSSLMSYCERFQCGEIASIIGRYYAMDRDKRWDRVQKAYELLTKGKTEFYATDAIDGLELAYKRGETDEFVQATKIKTKRFPSTIENGDTVIFMNFRADRARELTRAFIQKDFNAFQRSDPPSVNFMSLCEYDEAFNIPVIYPPQSLNHLLGEYISSLGLTQLRIAETEKYAHVTFFLNGGRETPYPKEDRILIPSPKVATYDLKPEMSAFELTEKLVQQIKSSKYDMIICNFANPDMVGHSGNLKATIRAVEVIDQCLGKIVNALQEVGGEALITADHGNAELMFDKKTHQPHTAHTSELVPLMYIGRKADVTKTNGTLSDIAPTMLYLMGISQPNEMTGQSLFKLQDKHES